MTFLIGKDLWEIVEIGYDEPTGWNTLADNDKIDKEVKKMNAQALFYIQIALGKSLFPRVVGARISKDAWKTLQEDYQGSNKFKVVKL